MKTLSGLPTDNLYKFVAIFGLVLIITSAAMTWSGSYEVARGELELERGRKAIREERNNFVEMADELKASLDAYAGGEREGVPQIEQTEVDEGPIEFAKDFVALKKYGEEVVTMGDELGDASERYLIDFKMYAMKSKRAMWLAMFGVTLTAVGFAGWYYKLQRYLDEEIEERVRQARAERGKAASEENEVGKESELGATEQASG